jgi:hypothetical protein
MDTTFIWHWKNTIKPVYEVNLKKCPWWAVVYIQVQIIYSIHELYGENETALALLTLIYRCTTVLALLTLIYRCKTVLALLTLIYRCKTVLALLTLIYRCPLRWVPGSIDIDIQVSFKVDSWLYWHWYTGVL